MNNAFSKLDCNFKILIYYYLDKIKIFNPIINEGIFEQRDEPYLDLLHKSVKDKLKNLRKNLEFDIEIKKKSEKNIHNFYEYTPIHKKRKY